jgi:hypothetical protein
MRTPDLTNYADMRVALELFTSSFAGSPEVGEATTLLADIDAERAKLAEAGLAAAVASADEQASGGDFEGAISTIETVKSRFADGPWLKATGDEKIAAAVKALEAKRGEWEIKNAAETLGKARAEFEAGRLDKAGELIADRAKWSAEARAKGDELAAEIERKAAAIAAEEKRAQERETVLAEFDRRMLAGEYAAAKKESESKPDAAGRFAEMLRAARRVAAARADEPAACIRGAQSCIGNEMELKLAKRTVTATVKSVSDSGLSVTMEFTINNQTRKRSATYEWNDLHTDQLAEFASRGGLKVEKDDAWILAAYASLAAADLDAALEAAEAAGENVLGRRLSRVIRRRRTQLAYEAAMKRARELVQKEQWEAATDACAKALELKPKDEKATELLAKIKYSRGAILVVRKDRQLVVSNSKVLQVARGQPEAKFISYAWKLDAKRTRRAWQNELLVWFSRDLKKGTTYRLSFYCKAVDGTREARINCGVTKKTGPYTKYAGGEIRAGTNWKEYAFEFTPNTDHPASDLRLCFQFGYQDQTLMLGDIMVREKQ